MKIDYKLHIIGEKMNYSPRKEFVEPLINSRKKIFEITAGNSYGKTFLLNLIAYACFADELDDRYILKSIKDSISRYNDAKYCELSYNLEFDLPDGDKLVLKKEVSKRRSVELKNREIKESKELHNSIAVLYDVPTNPSDRLNAVIRDLEIWNSNLHNKIHDYWIHLRDVERDFSSIRDEIKINEFKILDISYAEAIDLVKTEISSFDDNIKHLNVITDLTKISNEFKKLLSLQVSLKKSEGQLKLLKKPKKGSKKDENKIGDLQRNKIVRVVEFKEILIGLEATISKNEDLANFIKEQPTLNDLTNSIVTVDIEEIINDEDYVKSINDFKDQVRKLDEEVSFFVRKMEGSKKYIVYSFLKTLLHQINDLIEDEADGILEQITNNNTSALKDEIKKNMDQNKSPDFTEVNLYFKDLNKRIPNLIKEIYSLDSQIRKESNKQGFDEAGDRYNGKKAVIENYKERIRDTNSEIAILKNKLADFLDIDSTLINDLEKVNRMLSINKGRFKNQNVLTNLPASLKENQLSKDAKSAEKDKIANKKLMNLARLQVEEGKSESQYSEAEQMRIKGIMLSMQFMIRNLGNFNDVISSINSGDLDRFKDEEEKDFMDIAGSIIAYSMDNKILRADGEYIRLENYDLLNKQFHCENNVIIRKDDISTGLASGNYLRQRINNVEGDYVIILLDEIGNMDRRTLDNVIQSIKKLDSNKRLVLALLTQPNSEGINVNSF